MRAIVPSPASPVPSSQASASQASASWLAYLDERVSDPDASGVISVRGARPELSSLGRHLVRLAALPPTEGGVAGRRVLRVGGRGWADPYRELAFYLGVDDLGDPADVASALLDAAADAIVVVEHRRAAADHRGRSISCRASDAVEAEIADRLAADRSAPRSLWFLLGPTRSLGEVVEIAGSLNGDDIRSFCVAMIKSGAAPRAGASLSSLESWWRRVTGDVCSTSGAFVSAPAMAAAPTPQSEQAIALERRLYLLGRSCPADQLLRLGTAGAWADLLASGRGEIDEMGTLAVVTDAALTRSERDDATTEEDRLAAAAVLEAIGDPLSLLTAALLAAAANEWERAEATVMGAVSRAHGRGCRTAILEAWSHEVEAGGGDATGGRLLRAADVALRVGDPELALNLARRALSAGASTLAGRIIEGRAAMENGDLAAASAALDLAAESGESEAETSRVLAHRAELSLLQGRVEEAAELCGRALSGASAHEVRLVARNVAGKVLLSNGEWALAERHFAVDESAAAGAGDPEAELRARLNRAVALLSAGRREEATVVLEAVERDAHRRGMHRAVAFARANLATVSTLAHDYGTALRRWEEAISAVRAAGDRPKLARLIANVAELRVRLGLLTEAEEALAFGRRACRAGLSQPLSSLLSFVAAKLRLAQGRTLLASAEIQSAIAAASASSNGAKLGECHRLAVRIAIEDGDLARAEASLEASRGAASGPDAEIELTLLGGMVLRGRGKPFQAMADRALELAQGSGDPELSRQAHLLAFHAACEKGQDELACHHLQQAKRIRDEMASLLPDSVRGRFLARPDMLALDGLEATSALRVHGGASSPPSSGRRGGPGRGAVGRRSNAMVGETAPMKALAASIAKVGPSEVAVLVSGESGTGKELVADAVHRASDRREGPLVKVNCAALVETLLLSELFGHEKGAFTGAANRHLGRFEEARGGTLFLDEIGDISPRTQVALLRVLQDGTYYRVGGTTPLRADVRVICATHRDLRSMVERGEFRQDLYYRLCGVTLEVPALRERLGDLPLLCAESLARISSERGTTPQRVSEGALCAMRRHGWPGNVRELDNALRSASLFAEGGEIQLADLVENVESLRYLSNDIVLAGLDELPPSATVPSSPSSSLEAVYQSVMEGTSLPEMRRQLELGCILKALGESDGNVTQAAKKLGMKRPRLSQLIHQHGLKTKGIGAS